MGNWASSLLGYFRILPSVTVKVKQSRLSKNALPVECRRYDTILQLAEKIKGNADFFDLQESDIKMNTIELWASNDDGTKVKLELSDTIDKTNGEIEFDIPLPGDVELLVRRRDFITPVRVTVGKNGRAIDLEEIICREPNKFGLNKEETQLIRTKGNELRFLQKNEGEYEKISQEIPIAEMKIKVIDFEIVTAEMKKTEQHWQPVSMKVKYRRSTGNALPFECSRRDTMLRLAEKIKQKADLFGLCESDIKLNTIELWTSNDDGTKLKLELSETIDKTNGTVNFDIPLPGDIELFVKRKDFTTPVRVAVGETGRVVDLEEIICWEPNKFGIDKEDMQLLRIKGNELRFLQKTDKDAYEEIAKEVPIAELKTEVIIFEIFTAEMKEEEKLQRPVTVKVMYRRSTGNALPVECSRYDTILHLAEKIKENADLFGLRASDIKLNTIELWKNNDAGTKPKLELSDLIDNAGNEIEFDGPLPGDVGTFVRRKDSITPVKVTVGKTGRVVDLEEIICREPSKFHLDKDEMQLIRTKGNELRFSGKDNKGAYKEIAKQIPIVELKIDVIDFEIVTEEMKKTEALLKPLTVKVKHRRSTGNALPVECSRHDTILHLAETIKEKADLFGLHESDIKLNTIELWTSHDDGTKVKLELSDHIDRAKGEVEFDGPLPGDIEVLVRRKDSITPVKVAVGKTGRVVDLEEIICREPSKFHLDKDEMQLIRTKGNELRFSGKNNKGANKEIAKQIPIVELKIDVIDFEIVTEEMKKTEALLQPLTVKVKHRRSTGNALPVECSRHDTILHLAEKIKENADFFGLNESDIKLNTIELWTSHDDGTKVKLELSDHIDRAKGEVEFDGPLQGDIEVIVKYRESTTPARVNLGISSLVMHLEEIICSEPDKFQLSRDVVRKIRMKRNELRFLQKNKRGLYEGVTKEIPIKRFNKELIEFEILTAEMKTNEQRFPISVMYRESERKVLLYYLQADTIHDLAQRIYENQEEFKLSKKIIKEMESPEKRIVISVIPKKQGDHSEPLFSQCRVRELKQTNLQFYVEDRPKIPTNDDLWELCVDQTIAFFGSSGHGKSSTINTIATTLSGKQERVAATCIGFGTGTQVVSPHVFTIKDRKFNLIDVPGGNLPDRRTHELGKFIGWILDGSFPAKYNPSYWQQSNILSGMYRSMMTKTGKVDAVIVVHKGTAPHVDGMLVTVCDEAFQRDSGIPVFAIVTHVDQMTDQKQVQDTIKTLSAHTNLDEENIFSLSNLQSKSTLGQHRAKDRDDYVKIMLRDILTSAKIFRTKVNKHEK